MVNKKEGNITRVSNNNSPQAGNNLAASRQAGTHLPSGEGSNTPLASPLLSSGEGDGPRASQAGLGLGTHNNSSPQATAHLPPREGSNISQAIAYLPSGEGSNSPMATAHLPPREAGSSSQATAHLPSGERSSSSQAIAHLPHREGSNSPPATAHLPPGEGNGSSQATAHLPSGEGSSSSQANTHPSPGEGRGNSQAGEVGYQVRSGGQGLRHSTRHRASQASQENSTASQTDSTHSQESTPTIPNRLPQGSSNEEPNPKWVINLSSKPLTPAQRSVLAKGPNFVVTPKQPPNLEYITAIEAACTKLSQQDAEGWY